MTKVIVSDTNFILFFRILFARAETGFLGTLFIPVSSPWPRTEATETLRGA